MSYNYGIKYYEDWKFVKMIKIRYMINIKDML